MHKYSCFCFTTIDFLIVKQKSHEFVMGGELWFLTLNARVTNMPPACLLHDWPKVRPKLYIFQTKLVYFLVIYDATRFYWPKIKTKNSSEYNRYCRTNTCIQHVPICVFIILYWQNNFAVCYCALMDIRFTHLYFTPFDRRGAQQCTTDNTDDWIKVKIKQVWI